MWGLVLKLFMCWFSWLSQFCLAFFGVPRLPSGTMWNCMQIAMAHFWKPPVPNWTKFEHAPLYCTGLSLGLSLTRLYLKVSVSVSVSSTSLSLSLGLEKTISKVSVSVSVSKNQIPKSQSQSRSRKTKLQSLSISLSTRNPGLADLWFETKPLLLVMVHCMFSYYENFRIKSN